jgi:5-methylcytosine-specific restriction endonuclease McrA
MARPAAVASDTFLLCVNGIVNNSLRERILELAPSFNINDANYAAAGSVGGLYTIPANNQRNDEIVIGRVTKDELKEMYSYYLVDKSKPGRSVYDLMLASAPNGICPLCGVGHAVTLDHFLPKAKFPMFSVLPLNLIPACRDCNTGKLTAYATAFGEQSLHPYFDHGKYVSDQWLFATVVQTSPASVRFFVAPPANWSVGEGERVLSHFTSLKLGERFSVLAANELGSINAVLKQYIGRSGPDAVREYLNACAAAELGLHRNSWKGAMLLALASDNWFCQTGYQLV